MVKLPKITITKIPTTKTNNIISDHRPKHPAISTKNKIIINPTHPKTKTIITI
jgi:hypothetical protein